MSVGTQIVLSQIKSLDEAYQQIATQANLPADFGRNLDALYDVLTTDLAGPVQIMWRGFMQSEKIMPGTQFHDLMTVLNDAAGERDDLEVGLC
ncbi:barstar family protein [Chitinibacter bivalviorum]|uniref:Barstar family protein n=1 Tax=Chitinibacter bivalviorum TaxID=2739434 RepID=A0A7H9BIP3_9NEIS|nr:barstar family protein [Chitinibacter bivalviorum]QLG87424.1 barstar family protein [Chitinibacter bivalviorum]